MGGLLLPNPASGRDDALARHDQCLSRRPSLRGGQTCSGDTSRTRLANCPVPGGNPNPLAEGRGRALPRQRIDLRRSVGKTWRAMLGPGQDRKLSRCETRGISSSKPPTASSPHARSVMLGNRSQDTKPELLVRSALHRRGLRFRKHQKPVPGVRCTADIVFPRERCAVFIDGCFWHGCPIHGEQPIANADYWRMKIERNRARDRRNSQALTEAGWLVIRAWEHEDPEAVASRIETELLHRREMA
jgi:DNA mismatch endonuclease, patch repair protein